MQTKMNAINAADEAEYNRVQSVLAQREQEQQQTYDRFRQGEWADSPTPLAEMACVAEDREFIQPFLPWLPSLGLEKDIDIPLITIPILPYFVTAGYTLGVEAQTLAKLPTHLSNEALSLGAGPLAISLASDINSLGVGASFPRPFVPAQTIATSASVNWDGLWGTTFRYTADVVTTSPANMPSSASSSYSQGLYVEINPARVAAVAAIVTVAVLTPSDEIVAMGAAAIATINEAVKQLIPVFAGK